MTRQKMAHRSTTCGLQVSETRSQEDFQKVNMEKTVCELFAGVGGLDQIFEKE